MSESTAYSPVAVDEGTAPRVSFGNALAVGASILAIAAIWLSGRGELLRVTIPAAAVFVGVILYFSHPIRYVEYSLWLWFLTPLVRRLVDWRFGYADPNFVLLAPLMVSGIAGLGLLRANRAPARIPVPFILCGTAIIYAVVIDVLQHPSLDIAYGLVDWICPLIFGLHFYLNRHRCEDYQTAISRTFLCAIPVLGLYGIYQFFAPPAWDCYWLTNANLDASGAASSFGQPEPLLVRVWSTMNAPGPFANTMMVGLLLLLVVRSRLRVPAAIPGYVSFLLSVVRTAWLSWVIGFVLILKNANPRAMVRIVLSMTLLFACLIPLAGDPRIATVIKDRANTFTDLSQDGSLRARADMYGSLLDDAMATPFGYGFRNRQGVHGFVVDSGLLVAIFTLGWLGTLLFATGMIALCVAMARSVDKRDQFSLAAKGIVISLLAQLVSGNIFVSVSGAMFWMFAGLCMAATRNHGDQLLSPGRPASA